MPDEDRKLLLTNILARIDYFTERIRWSFPRDLKPRINFGLKTDGTIVDIHDSDGYPTIITRRPPATLMNDEAFAWAAAPGAVAGAAVQSTGWHNLTFITIQPLWIAICATLTAHIEYSIDGTIWSTEYGAHVQSLSPVNSRVDWFTLNTEIISANVQYHVVGELAPYWRLVLTTTGAGTEGTIHVHAFGSN